jgi:hypothetical protein
MKHDILAQKLQILRDRYYILAPLLVLVFAASLGGSPPLAWAAGILLVLLTVNVLIPHLRKH